MRGPWPARKRLAVVVGLGAMALCSSRSWAHIYAVKDPVSGVIYYTNAPSAGQARIIVRELPRPLPVSAMSPSRLPPNVSTQGFDGLIRAVAKAYDVEYALVKAIVKAESGFNHRAVSPKGAQGLMQLMPATARRRGVKDSFDPRDNIEGGVRHLKWLLDRYSGNVDLAVAAYNCGEGRVESAGGIPNIAETQEYVRRVRRFREGYKRERERPSGPAGPGVVFVTAGR